MKSFVIYEIKVNNVCKPLESANSPYEAIIRCAELRFAGYQATAYEVVVNVDTLKVERTVLY